MSGGRPAIEYGESVVAFVGCINPNLTEGVRLLLIVTVADRGLYACWIW